MSKILDSGNRTEFSTGAVRDMHSGKGRFDLVPLDVVAKIIQDDCGVLEYLSLFMQYGDSVYLYSAIYHAIAAVNSDGEAMFDHNVFTMALELAVHFEDGSIKYGPDNWRLGIPPSCYIDSAARHYIKWLRGDKDERHDRAFVWNIVCCLWEIKQNRNVEQE